MEEKKFVSVLKSEFNIKEFVKQKYGKGKISDVKIEYTPLGEKIIIATHKPGLIIGKNGEKIAEITEILKKNFKMENPHITIEEIRKLEFDAQLVADEIALAMERFGLARHKSVCYKMLGRIKKAGALGCEIRASGKLPSDRAKSWRYTFGYLKKTGGSADVVDKAKSVAETKQGVAGIKVAILTPEAKIHDRIDITEDLLAQIKKNAAFKEEVQKEKKTKKIKKQ